MSRGSVLISEKEADEVAFAIKKAEEDLKQLMSQKTLPVDSSIWSRRGTLASIHEEPNFIPIGKNSEHQNYVKKVKSDKFIAEL